MCKRWKPGYTLVRTGCGFFTWLVPQPRQGYWQKKFPPPEEKMRKKLKKQKAPPPGGGPGAAEEIAEAEAEGEARTDAVLENFASCFQLKHEARAVLSFSNDVLRACLPACLPRVDATVCLPARACKAAYVTSACAAASLRACQPACLPGGCLRAGFHACASACVRPCGACLLARLPG